jgi:hypothetical protein
MHLVFAKLSISTFPKEANNRIHQQCIKLTVKIARDYANQKQNGEAAHSQMSSW